MSEILENNTSEVDKIPETEAHKLAVADLGSALHEDWRAARKLESGTFEPREKKTTDSNWVEAHGTDVVDIANTDFADLPVDWQAENAAAAEVVVSIVESSDGIVDLDDSETYSRVGNIIHDAWLSRNEWAKGGELDVPFDQLPQDEKDKDINQAVIANSVFET